MYKGARLVSYDDVAEEEEGEGDKEKVNKYMYLQTRFVRKIL